MEETKTCTKCKRDLLLTNFARRGDAKHRYRSHCEECRRTYNRNHLNEKRSQRKLVDPQGFLSEQAEHMREWRSNNRESYNAYQNERYRKKRQGGDPAPRRSHRRWIFEKDDGICQICNEFVDWEIRYPDPLSFSVDHRKPICAGGTDDPVNLDTSHLVCNMRKNRTYDQG